MCPWQGLLDPGVCAKGRTQCYLTTHGFMKWPAFPWEFNNPRRADSWLPPSSWLSEFRLLCPTVQFPRLASLTSSSEPSFKCFVIVQTVRKSQCPRHGDSLAWIFLPKIITFLFVQTKCLGRGCLPHSVLLKLPSPRIRADNKHHSKGHHLLSTSYVLSDWEYRI